MTPQQFRQDWQRTRDDPLMVFSDAALMGIKLPDESRLFLVEAGLPSSAAPFLGFEVPTKGPLPLVSTIWPVPERFAKYRIIGSNGSGDPVCLDESGGGQIVYLNHDNDFERTLMGSSITLFAECLLVFRNFIAEVGGIADPLSEAQAALVLDRLRAVDPRASGPGSFWEQESKNLLD